MITDEQKLVIIPMGCTGSERLYYYLKSIRQKMSKRFFSVKASTESDYFCEFSEEDDSVRLTKKLSSYFSVSNMCSD